MHGILFVASLLRSVTAEQIFYYINTTHCLQVLHYAQELFEGMKAYRGVDDQVTFLIIFTC